MVNSKRGLEGMRSLTVTICLFLAAVVLGVFSGFHIVLGIKESQTWFEPWHAFSKETAPLQGQIMITSREEITRDPIENVVFQIASSSDSTPAVYTVTTDATGTAVSPKLDYGYYVIQQVTAPGQFEQGRQQYEVPLFASQQIVSFKHATAEHIQQFRIEETGNLKITKLWIPVPELLQIPELPNGCEITTATVLLQYSGYEVMKTEMSDSYLPKQPFVRKAGKLYGPDPHVAFAGDPRSSTGFFAYPEPIVKAVSDYLQDVNGNHRAVDISGSTREYILAQLDQGIPVAVWITLDLGEPKLDFGWYITESGQYYQAPVNLHAVVLNGYEGDKLNIMNPLEGHMQVDADAFFDSYEQMGRHAMMVVEQ